MMNSLMTAAQPITYTEASDGNLADQIDRYRELAGRDTMARSIAILKARGAYAPGEHVDEERFPPLTVAEHLEMLAPRRADRPLLPAPVPGPPGRPRRGRLGADRGRHRRRGGHGPRRLPEVGGWPAPAPRRHGHRPRRRRLCSRARAGRAFRVTPPHPEKRSA
jgi:hypothetical protein